MKSLPEQSTTHQENTMKFTKMHNAGNDYIYIEKEELDSQNFPLPKLAQKISHRRYGIGSDGIVIIDKKKRAMQMFNADGSESEMCGNALLCVAKYLFEKKVILEKKFSILYAKKNYALEVFLDKQGIIQKTSLQVEKPSLQMGEFLHPAKRIKKKQFLQERFDFGDFQLTGSLLALQNPHFVVFVDNLEKTPVKKWGAVIEKHPFFPQGINIEFVQVINFNQVIQRTWERGSGETWACGSGAIAVCTSSYLNKKTNRDLQIKLLGGTIEVSYQDSYVLMTGNPKKIFCGETSF